MRPHRYKNWTVTLFAENIFDKEYFLYNDNDIAATVGRRFGGHKLDGSTARQAMTPETM